MGLWDEIMKANKEFVDEVSDAWHDLVDDQVGDDAVDSIIKSRLRGDRTTSPTSRRIENLFAEGKKLDVQPGTPVYCKLAGYVEHSGIYIGGGDIVHLNGNGEIESISCETFISRLDGLNCPINIAAGVENGIFCPVQKNEVLYLDEAESHARSQIGRHKNYSLTHDNCHRFTMDCLLAKYGSKSSSWTFDALQNIILSEFGKFKWVHWNYYDEA